jgi:hypothetical protein
VLISILVFNNIGDPSFVEGGWAIAEFVVRVAFDKVDLCRFFLTVLIAVPY